MTFVTKMLASGRFVLWLAVAALLLASLLPALLNQQSVRAAQILDRSIAMATSQASVETSYNVSFQVPGGALIGGWRLEFCDEDPLPGQPCNVSTVEGTTVPSLDADTGSAITISNITFADVAFDTVNAATTCTAPALRTTHGAASNLTYLDITCDTDNAAVVQETIAAGGGSDTDYINFTINNINNPSSISSFFARIYTFTQDGPAGGTNQPIPTYVAATPPLGNYEGGVAMSTADQITVEARVQERLTFTVGTDTVASNCAAISGTTVDLGVLDSTDAVFNRATVNGAAATPNLDGICTEVITNAANGASISYLATDLQVTGATCTFANGDIDGTTAISTDQCINWEDTTPSAYVAGTEKWGIGVLSTPQNGSTTNMTVTDASYDRSTWTDTVKVEPYATSAVPIADTNGTVADTEALLIDVAAESAITTPTGLYQATLTFIATGSF